MTLAGFWKVSCVGRVLRVLGLVLLVIGAAGWLLPAGAAHWTALIPAALGVLALLASLPQNAFAQAGLGAAVSLAALAGGGSALADLPALLEGEAGAAIVSRAATALAAILALCAMAYALTFGRRSV